MTESTTIEHIYNKLNLKEQHKGFGAFGDDAVCVPSAGPSEKLVVSSDSFVEGVHFDRSMGFFSAGWKSLVGALSDVFAMGVSPSFYTLNLILPSGFEKALLDQFLDGLSEASRSYNVNLLGGDVSRGPQFCVVIQASGYQNKDFIKTNSDFSKGDVILTEAHLGHALLGYKEFLKGVDASPYVERFLFPKLNEHLGPWLGTLKEVTSLTDISDGLYKELTHMCEIKNSKVLLEDLPIDSEFIKACEKISLDPQKIALEGGEEYELLWTVKPEALPNFLTQYQMRFKKKPLVLGRVGGRVIDSALAKIVYENQSLIESIKPFEHFTS